MKKSEVYHKAQLSVMRDHNITYEEALEVLYILMKEEEWAKTIESRKEAQENGKSV